MTRRITEAEALQLVGNYQALLHLKTSRTPADLMNGAQLTAIRLDAFAVAFELSGTEEQIDGAVDHLGQK